MQRVVYIILPGLSRHIPEELRVFPIFFAKKTLDIFGKSYCMETGDPRKEGGFRMEGYNIIIEREWLDNRSASFSTV